MKPAFFLAFAVLVRLVGPFPLFAETAPEEVLVQEVVKEFQRHDYKKVIDLYRRFTADQPGRYLPLVVKVFYSQALADTGEIDGAIDSLRDVLNELPPEVDPFRLRYDLGNLLFLEKRYDEAEAVYRRLLSRAHQVSEFTERAKERLASIREKDSKKRDHSSLEMMDIETALDAGEIPQGADALLKRVIDQNAASPQSHQVQEARRLQARVREIRTRKAQALLDEARRFFDEKKYADVREILQDLERSYADVSESPSVEALQKAVEAKLGKKRN